MAYFSNILFSTTNAISGYEIIDHKGIVFERVVSGVGVISELFASFTDVFGGRSGRMEDQLDTLYTELFSAMARKAEKVGANAVVGFSIDIDEISGKGVSMLMISGTGTAVTVQPIGHVSDNRPVRKKEEPWKCVKCGMISPWQSNYCPICGEKRHFEWKCQNCNADNAAEANYCPSCGKKRTAEEEVVIDYSQPTLHSFDMQDLVETLQEMKNAAEIHEYLKKTFADEANEEMHNLLNRMEGIVRFERTYGNGKNEAIRTAKGFFEHGCKIFLIDKGKTTIECPCCGASMKNDRKNCYKCGALFEYLE